MTRSILILLLTSSALTAADRSLQDNPDLQQYFAAEVARIERQSSLFQYMSLEDWEKQKPKLRGQLFDMLGMNPLPERTPLQAEVTGTVEADEFRVENLHFQSLPGLYVTANLYLPKHFEERLPTVLYVCGHGRVKKGDISYGNKTHYQHHGAWFARNGYACLTIDTLQLGEIEGIHHGTYNHDRWWWNSRGYTPAGVEAWNCIRALDYLETRDEVDSQRFGVTGRSGGGAYSWWIAALDERIQCAIPVAGITTLQNHVLDGCVEGHCDCMYMVNTFGWNYATVAALVAPRPLLISNSDKDGIFPLEGVVEIHRQVRHIYDLYNKPNHLGLQITEGPHKDTQELRVHAFRWLNRWLKNDDSLIETTAKGFFEPEQLKVFRELPADERNTSIDEDFTPLATAPTADRAEQILTHQKEWLSQSLQELRTHSFAAWPADSKLTVGMDDVKLERLQLSARVLNDATGLTACRVHFKSQEHVPLFLDLIYRTDARSKDVDLRAEIANLKSLQLTITDTAQWQRYAAACLGAGADSADSTSSDETASNNRLAEKIRGLTADGTGVAVFSPRGTGPHAWNGDERKQVQIRRRFQLIGTTADAMRVWDIRCALSVLRVQCPDVDTTIAGREWSGWLGLTAMLLDGQASRGRFTGLATNRDGFPVFLNAGRHFTPQEFLALALQTSSISAVNCDPELIKFAQTLTGNAEWQGRKLNVE